jgi:hypothetical protein
MIRNFQKSSDSNVDLSPIYSSLQTINAFLYQLDVQTTLSRAINSISSSYNSLSNDVNELSGAYNSLEQRFSTISNGNVNFITDTLLTKHITNYNTYYNSNFEIFEPYVQSITNFNYISAAYPNQRYYLPNATLNDTNANQAQITKYTLDKIDGGMYLLSDCVINTVTNFNGGVGDCTIDRIHGSTIMMAGGKAVALECKEMGQISIATIYGFSGSNCTVEKCILDGVRATSCIFDKCTMIDTPWYSNSYKSMTLTENKMQFCGFTDCVINNQPTTGYYSECSFKNVTFPQLNSTNFSKCSGTVFIPKVVNNSVVFDEVNGNYLYGEGDYVTIYTEPSTYTNIYNGTSTYTNLTEYTSTLTTNYYVSTDYTRSISDTAISRVTTETIVSDNYGIPMYPTTTTIDKTVTVSTIETLTKIATTIYTFEELQGTTTFTGQWVTTKTYPHYYDSTLTKSEPYTTTRTLTNTISLTSTLTPQLLVKCLPEYNYKLPPTQLMLSTLYKNNYVDINFVRNSTNDLHIENCTGNLYLYVDTVKTLSITDNSFTNMELDVKDMTLSSFRYNIITNCTLNLYSVDANSNDIDYNEISNLVVNQYGPQTGFQFTGNVFYRAKFLAFTDDVTLSHAENSYFAATFEGLNLFSNCTMTSMTNEGTCDMKHCTVSELVVNNAATIRSCTIERLIVNPDVYSDYNIEDNEIGTLIIPDYMHDIYNDNMVNDMFTH